MAPSVASLLVSGFSLFPGLFLRILTFLHTLDHGFALLLAVSLLGATVEDFVELLFIDVFS